MRQKAIESAALCGHLVSHHVTPRLRTPTRALEKAARTASVLRGAKSAAFLMDAFGNPRSAAGATCGPFVPMTHISANESTKRALTHPRTVLRTSSGPVIESADV
jgi:hypothetical protein